MRRAEPGCMEMQGGVNTASSPALRTVEPGYNGDVRRRAHPQKNYSSVGQGGGVWLVGGVEIER